MSEGIMLRGSALVSSVIVILPVLGGFISSMIAGALASGTILYLFWNFAGILTAFNLNHPNFGQYFYQGFIRLPIILLPIIFILLFGFLIGGVLFLIIGVRDFFRYQGKQIIVVNSGIYSKIRHPQNLGIILLGLSVFLASFLEYNHFFDDLFMIYQESILIRIGDIYSIFVFSVIWLIESVWEEEKMMQKNTDLYSTYREKTVFMVPYFPSLGIFKILNPNLRFKYKLILWTVIVVIFILVTSFLVDLFDILYHTK